MNTDVLYQIFYLWCPADRVYNSEAIDGWTLHDVGSRPRSLLFSVGLHLVLGGENFLHVLASAGVNIPDVAKQAPMVKH